MGKVSNQMGNRIRQYRRMKGLTQEALAFGSGINVSFLGDVERGIKKPSVESLEKLLNALGVTFREFFDFEAGFEPVQGRTALEKINMKLQSRPDAEVEMIHGVIEQILLYNDGGHTRP